MNNFKYHKLLSTQYKNTHSVITEMINLQALVNLPKGTEHFVSDIHGEYDAFYHIIQNASGAIKMYIEDIFGLSMSQEDKKNLSLMIYYPEERLQIVEQKINKSELDDFYKITLFRLVKVLKRSTAKYTRSKVRKALPERYAYVLEELIHEDITDPNKQMYYTKIISTIVEFGSQKEFIIAICGVIHQLIVDHLHIIGDIFDRGPYPDKVMDLLIDHHSLDIQWGNHDISWIGASAGNEALICTVIRICAKYNHLSLLEDSYGINLVPLVMYAMEVFKDDDCSLFTPVDVSEKDSEKDLLLYAKLHKAIALLQFKVEAELISKRQNYDMNDRILLDKIDFEKSTVTINGDNYPLLDSLFPSVNKENPLYITPDERDLLEKLRLSFLNSAKLTKHVDLLLKKGGMYKVWNNNLLFHGSIPMDENRNLRESNIFGTPLKGKAFIDELDMRVRDGYEKRFTDKNHENIDLMWYLWCGQDSPLFGKDKMATFENYYISDKKVKVETKDPYFTFRDSEEVVNFILHEFGLHLPISKIMNGHVPVKVKKGESPVKANGKLIAIDGGLTKAYQKVTGISGYTLISNSVGLYLAEHEPFTSREEIVKKGIEIISNNTIIERYNQRLLVKDTDNGKILLSKIEDLRSLLSDYNTGVLQEEC